jgi:hypothetical protein
MQIRAVQTPTKDYSEYWEAQVLLVRILQNSGVKVGIKDRLPIFRLWQVVSKKMAGNRATTILKLLDSLVRMRQNGEEPPNTGKKYL